MKITVVGGGLGGLAAAALLAKDGHEVAVYEKNETIGGRASVFSRDGFLFDMGPTWYLMPDVFDNFFAHFGKKSSDFYRLFRLDPSFRIFYDDGDVVDIVADMEKNFMLFDKLERGGGEKLRKFLQKCEKLYESISKTLYKDLDSPLSLFQREILLQGLQFNIFESMESFIYKRFESDKARKILLYSIGFVGTPPAKAPAFYSILSYLKLAQGVYYPEGGIRRVVEAVYDLAKSHGVEFYLGYEINKIKVIDGRARRIISDGNSWETDAVVVNADYAYAETKLLEPRYWTYGPSYWEKRTYTPSALVAYIGVDHKLDSLITHNIFLERDWAEKFYQIFDPRYAKWPEYASYYVHVPSKINVSAAPHGCEALFILVPIGAGLDDSDEKRHKLFTKVVKDLENKTGESIENSIGVKYFFSIRDFTTRYNAYRGSALGLAHTLSQTAFWRPRHKSRKVKNLYYTGQYTHPGIGLPMVLISAEIVARKIERELR
ncbi:MAG: phytoene desaturase family protein [Nitrososphaerota archaeon]